MFYLLYETHETFSFSARAEFNSSNADGNGNGVAEVVGGRIFLDVSGATHSLTESLIPSLSFMKINFTNEKLLNSQSHIFLNLPRGNNHGWKIRHHIYFSSL